MSELNNLHWMYARSLRSAESAVLVASCNTLWTNACASSGLVKKSLTTAVNVCSWTGTGSSAYESRNVAINSDAFSIWPEYSPRIQINDDLASGSSSSSSDAHSVGMIPS